MRTPITLSILLALATIPLAIAGGNAGAALTYDTATAESCETRSSSTYQSDSYSTNYSSESWTWNDRQRTKSCESSHTTLGLTASDNQGELAYVGLGGSDSSTESDNSSSFNSNYESWNPYYGSSSSYWSSYRQEDSSSEESWRGATARAGDDQAQAGTSCTSEDNWGYESQYNSHWSSSQWGYSSDSSHQSRHTNSYADECRRGIAASKDGRAAGAGASNGCEANYEDESRYYEGYSQYGSYSGAYGQGEGTNECRNGLYGEGAGESAWAGLANGCKSQSEWYGDPHGNSSQYDQFGKSQCRNGVIVEGPTGMNLFVGVQDNQESYCTVSNETYTCDYYNSGRSAMVEMDWAQDPTGANPQGFYVPLP